MIVRSAMRIIHVVDVVVYMSPLFLILGNDGWRGCYKFVVGNLFDHSA